MWSGLVHGGIWLEVLFNKVLILFEEDLNISVGSSWVLEDLIEVSSHLVLLLVESVRVHQFVAVDVLGHEPSEYTPFKNES